MSLKMDVHQEVEPISPWEDEESIGFISLHNSFDSKNTDINPKDFNSLAELEFFLDKKGYVVQKLFCYDHGSIAIKAAEENPFGCQWDSFLFGFLILSKDEAKSIYMKKRISSVIKTKAKTLLKSFSETLNSYYAGDVYGYEITDDEGDVVDSCYGFYGYQSCEEAGNESLNSFK